MVRKYLKREVENEHGWLEEVEIQAIISNHIEEVHFLNAKIKYDLKTITFTIPRQALQNYLLDVLL